MSSESDLQKQISDAFLAAPLALKDGRTDAEKKASNKFLLHNYDYYNLQKYLHAGISLPLDAHAFEALFKPANLRKLTEIDASVYANLEFIFNVISKNCLDFEHDTMPQFMTVTGGVINYCNDMDRYLSGPGLLSDQIKILTADGVTNASPAWSAACQKIKIILGILSNRATARTDDIDKLVAGLTQFKALTEVDYENVTYLKHQFITGKPVYKSIRDRSEASNQMTYSERLNDTFGKLQKDIDNLQKTIRDEEAERQHDIVVAATAVTYAWIFPVGTIAAAAVMSVYTARAIEMKGKIDANKGLLADDQAQMTSLSDCLTTVQGIIGDIRSVADSIEAAITALANLKGSFTQQSIDFKNLSDQWSNIYNSSKTSTFAEEAALDMQPSVQSATSSWAEIKQLALDFQTNSAIQYVTPNP